MDIQAIKQRILKGEMTDEELAKLFVNKTNHKQSGSFLKTVLQGVDESYTNPLKWRMILNASLLVIIIIAIVFLSYSGKIDTMVTTILLSFVLGYLFGKIK